MHNIFDDMVSHTHDEPDHEEDYSAGAGVTNAVALGIAIVGAITFACVALAYVASRLIS